MSLLKNNQGFGHCSIIFLRMPEYSFDKMKEGGSMLKDTSRFWRQHRG